MKLIFDTYGNEKQKEVARYWIDKKTRDIIYGGSKYSGKSYLGCSLIFGDAFIYPGTHYFIARKHLNDLRKFTIPSIYEVFNHWGIDKRYYNYNGQDNYFTLTNDSKIYLLDAKSLPSDPLFQRFGSMQMTRGWIEEAGEFEIDAMKNLKISIGRWKNSEYKLKGKLLQTCNPTKNYLYYDYYLPNKKGILPVEKKFVQAFPEDNKKASPDYIQNLYDTLTGSEKERLLKGNWEYDDDPLSLIRDYASIINLFEANYHCKTGQYFITCDVARFGSDKAIIILWDGLTLIDYKVFDISDIPTQVNYIQALQQKYYVKNSNVIIDSDGVGGGVADYVKGVNFVANKTPLITNDMKEQYGSIKDQAAFKLAELINNGGITIECKDISDSEKERIISEVEQLRRKDGTRKLEIIAKKDMKENLFGKSTDWLDNFIMRAYAEILYEEDYELEVEIS